MTEGPPVVAWTGWRGPSRDGRVPWLPAGFAEDPDVIWRVPLSRRGLGGVAATEKFVIISDRELEDTIDSFKCYRADTGELAWSVQYPAIGQLDYGNSPRATPLIHDGRVYLFGAFGDLSCADLKTGELVWQINVRDEFGATDERPWGTCSSPLIADGKLIINPGAKDVSLVALDPKTGNVVWKTPGRPASYGSFIVGDFGGVRQLVGFDADSLGGWDVKTGERLWRIAPTRESEFNVPTPIRTPAGDLVIALENNGTALYGFGEDGRIVAEPKAKFAKLSPDTHTPVLTNGRVFGAWRRLYSLDLDGLGVVWESDLSEFDRYCSLIATDERVLATTLDGELILFAATGDAFREISRLRPLPDERGCYSHPALVGTRLYLRGSSELLCIELKE